MATVLEIAKKRNMDVIFVTNDQKNDWFYKQDKIGLYPKYELFDEFRRYTNGKSISIINFIKFLELSDADAKTVKDVKIFLKKKQFQEEEYINLNYLKNLEVEHTKFGLGRIQQISGEGSFKKASIFFRDYGVKNLLLQFAKLKILDNDWNRKIYNQNFRNNGNNDMYEIVE